MITGKSLPKEMIDFWPEVFGDITLTVVPLIYLQAISLHFKNTKVWEIKINKLPNIESWEAIEYQLKEIVSTYESEIKNIDFKLDTDRIKKDITAKTKKFLKHKKLR